MKSSTTERAAGPGPRGRMPHRPTAGHRCRPVLVSLAITATFVGGVLPHAFAQTVPEAKPSEIQPLALKEEMIRDRFQRFEDRVYRLRELLAQTEPDNAGRLAHVLERAGELGLADQLQEMIRQLRDPSALNQALDAQGQWLENADRLLAILLERDGDDEAQRREMERLQRQREEVGKILEQERALRADTGKSGAAARMLEQIDQALKRLHALQNTQSQISKQTQSADQAEKPASERLSQPQQELSRDTQQLAEDLARLSQQKPEGADDAAPQESAREKTGEASKSLDSAANAMSQAGSKLQSGDSPSASPSQQQASQAMQQAREQLEAAKRELEKEQKPDDAPKLAEEQRDISKQTGELNEQMQKDASSGQGQSGGKQGKPSPGQQSVQNAQKQMDKAAESLDQSKQNQAAESEDRAIEELEQAQKELEEALAQMRKEEREETLRDLESRFREMLTKQRVINDETGKLADTGEGNFRRAERLQLADLSTRERGLSQDAAACVHILDEDGTTVVVPRVLSQLSEDMRTVSERLAATDVGTITRTIEQEIVDTLEQLLESVQRMQQENEQQAGRPSENQEGPSPLLPPSAELKLLRAGQVRINTRTAAIEETRSQGTEPQESVKSAMQTVAVRQAECANIAEELRSRLQQP